MPTVKPLRDIIREHTDNKAQYYPQAKEGLGALQSIGLKHIKAYHPKDYSREYRNKVTEVLASTERNSAGNPVTFPGHKTATGVAYAVNHIDKHIKFREITSKQKGMGSKMVDAIIKAHPNHSYSMMDLSRRGDGGPSFWDKMKAKHKELSEINAAES